jgi:hypothetical protein
MLNVDTGNSPEKPDNPRELRATWRLTLFAIAGLVLFALLFFAVARLQDAADVTPHVEQQQRGAAESDGQP